ncbi:MAG: phosphoribosyltransferase family protein [Bacteroidota bacterium]
MLSDLVSLLFPSTCLGCGDSLTFEEEYICLRCKLDLPLTNDYLAVENTLFQKFAYENLIKSASSYMFYQQNGIAQKLLKALKYKGERYLGNYLGKLMAETLKGPDFTSIIPIPIHRVKKRIRGYNQARHIAEGISEQLDRPIIEPIKRIRNPKSQTKKSRIERWKGLENIYGQCEADLSDQSILIVDDVITTGATVGLLCERLKEANVGAIHICSVARGK